MVKSKGPGPRPCGRVCLHYELMDILKGGPLPLKEIADGVNKRKRYKKHDGSKVTVKQVCARMIIYYHLFRRVSRGVYGLRK